VILVACHYVAVRQDHPCPEQVVRGQPVLAAEDPQPATQGEAGDPHVWSAAGRDRKPVLVERVVHVAQAGPGPHRRHVAGDRYRAHRRDVDHDALCGRASREAVPPAPGHHPQPPASRERDSLRDVLGGLAEHHGQRSRVTKAGYGRIAHRFVPWRLGEQYLPRDSTFQRFPIGSLKLHIPPMPGLGESPHGSKRP
jgi:hypothetical protein